ncbi:Eukaryotic translation elongation factor 1 beta 2 [Fasciola gigantica]|uniref:Eukaryotic translation elongation factor 1 beta 2 n=1 Tax=Fasciola gigantica TaxID=46835 RepID=A0A504YNW9_FASGI|nr:Eukaryotic translation elongation factor 1 beta 2 [Fasciola gigantica]
MGFGDLGTDSGIKALDDYLLSRSYIEGFQPSQADVVVYQSVGKKPSAKYHNAVRWYNHIDSFGNERDSFPGQPKPVEQFGSSAVSAPPPKSTPAKNDDDENDDDIDLFGSDGDEEELARAREERVAAAKAAQSVIAKPIAKSTIVLDVKPWSDETDMAEVERLVRSIQTDGLLWGSSRLVPLAYGIRKLQIGCVVEDEKVGTDFLEEEITKFEDHVQSVDIVSFQKV